MNEKRKKGKGNKEQKMRKWMDKGAAKAEGGTPAPRGVTFCPLLLATVSGKCVTLSTADWFSQFVYKIVVKDPTTPYTCSCTTWWNIWHCLVNIGWWLISSVTVLTSFKWWRWWWKLMLLLWCTYTTSVRLGFGHTLGYAGSPFGWVESARSEHLWFVDLVFKRSDTVL